MALTPARQRNGVSEGMALGLLMCGRDELPFDKQAVDLSFAGAWHTWSQRNRFPQVSTDLRNGSDGVWVMLHADQGKRVLNLYWETDMRTITVCARGEWIDGEVDPETVAEGIDGDVPPSGWRELAEAFLARFDPA